MIYGEEAAPRATIAKRAVIYLRFKRVYYADAGTIPNGPFWTVVKHVSPRGRLETLNVLRPRRRLLAAVLTPLLTTSAISVEHFFFFCHRKFTDERKIAIPTSIKKNVHEIESFG